jgi:hypothetical protein
MADRIYCSVPPGQTQFQSPTPYQQITLSFKTHAPGGSLTFNLHVTFALLLCKFNSTFSPQTLEHSGIYPFSSLPSSSRPIIHCPISPARRESYMNSLLWEQRRRWMASRRRRPSRHLVATRRRGATVRTSKVKVSPSMMVLFRQCLILGRKRTLT